MIGGFIADGWREFKFDLTSVSKLQESTTTGRRMRDENNTATEPVDILEENEWGDREMGSYMEKIKGIWLEVQQMQLVTD